MTNDLTTGEMFESLNGFEEIAIQKTFGAPITDWAPDEDTGDKGNNLKTLRALVFIAEKRSGKKDAEAYQAAMTQTIGEIQTYFAEDPDEIDPDEPVTEPGKDG